MGLAFAVVVVVAAMSGMFAATGGLTGACSPSGIQASICCCFGTCCGRPKSVADDACLSILLHRPGPGHAESSLLLA